MKVFNSNLRLSQKEDYNDEYVKEIEKFNKLVEHLNIVKSKFITDSKHISTIEKEKLYNELNSLIKSTHSEFITLCKNISDIIFKKYLFEQQSQTIFEIITNETEKAIYNIFNEFSYTLSSKILYDLIYEYLQTDDDRNKIKNAKYLHTVGISGVYRNTYWIDKIILKVIGYDI